MNHNLAVVFAVIGLKYRPIISLHTHSPPRKRFHKKYIMCARTSARSCRLSPRPQDLSCLPMIRTKANIAALCIIWPPGQKRTRIFGSHAPSPLSVWIPSRKYKDRGIWEEGTALPPARQNKGRPDALHVRPACLVCVYPSRPLIFTDWGDTQCPKYPAAERRASVKNAPRPASRAWLSCSAPCWP